MRFIACTAGLVNSFMFFPYLVYLLQVEIGALLRYRP